MQGNWRTKIIPLILLFGILQPSIAPGSHLDSPSPSLSSQFQQSRIPQKKAKPIRQSPASLPSSLSHSESSTSTRSRHIAKDAERSQEPAKPHTTLGWRFLLHGQHQAAIAAYRQALRQNPQSARAYLGLGISLKGLGKVNLAKKAFVKAVDLNPRLPSALVHLGYLYAEGHFGQSNVQTARRLFKEASQLGDPFANIALLEMQSQSKL